MKSSNLSSYLDELRELVSSDFFHQKSCVYNTCRRRNASALTTDIQYDPMTQTFWLQATFPSLLSIHLTKCDILFLMILSPNAGFIG